VTDPADWSEPSAAPLDEDGRDLRPLLEAVLLVADQPLDEGTLARAVERPRSEVAATLRGLAADYDDEARGFELQHVAGGWRYTTRAEYADVVERFVIDGAQARLTQAALETLAVIAYRQPVSRSRISAIRGVNVEAVVRTLVARGLVEDAGTDPSGTAVLYRTTPYFLERLGLESLADLPEVADYLPDLDLVDDPEA
jgi:segregation and condensation protein B